MAQAIWTGHISFGLVNVPVSLHSLEARSNELSLHLVDRRNGAAVRYKRVNEDTGEEVPWDEIVRGYDADAGTILLTDEDLEQAQPVATQALDLESFVDASSIDPMSIDKPYILVPAKKGAKAYVLLREAMEKTGTVGIGRVVLRTRQYLAALKVEGDALVLLLLRYHDQLKPLSKFDIPKESASAIGIKPKEMEMATSLVESMTAEWDPTAYRDEYKEKVIARIEEKAKTGEFAPREETEETEKRGEVVDLMAALKKSLGGDDAKPAKKTAAKTHSARASHHPKASAHRTGKKKAG
jgi:DNA end-binding protein Ku